MMKKLLIALIAVAASVSANAQFMSNLNNFTAGVVTQDTDGDGVGDIDLPAGFNVEVFAGTDATGALLGSGSSIGFGFFDVGAADIGAATADVFVRIFEGQDFASSLTTGTGVATATGGNVNGVPPELPGSLTSFASGIVVTTVPEPSTIALAVLGLGALALRRRKA